MVAIDIDNVAPAQGPQTASGPGLRLAGWFVAFAAVSYGLFAADFELRQPSHPVPDGYAALALHWHALLTELSPAAATSFGDFAGTYYQTSNWLTAFLAGIVMLVTGTGRFGVLVAFFLVSLAASAVTSCFLYAYLRDRLQLDAWARTTTMLVFWSNLVVMSSLLRPMTDAVVLACFAAGLYVVTGRPRTPRAVLLTIAVLCVGIMAKVSFVTLLCAPLATWLLQGVRSADRRTVRLPLTLACLAVPLAAWCFVMSGLGAIDTVILQSRTLDQFAAYRGGDAFLWSLLLAGQGLLLAAWLGGDHDRRATPWLLPLVWVTGYIVLIVVSGVPFLNRHFLPVTLGLTILSAPTIARCTGRCRALPSLSIAGNLVVAAYLVLLPSAIGHFLPLLPIARLAYG